MSDAETRIVKDGFGTIKHRIFDCEKVSRYTLINTNNAIVRLISWGAAIQSIRIPNNNGIFTDVALGFDDIGGYLKSRYVGRICGETRCTFNTRLHEVSNIKVCNYEDPSLNKDIDELDNVNWNSYILGKQVVMSHLSTSRKNNEYSNTLFQVKYSWTDANQLHINIRATSTIPTPFDVTSYCLFNLAGHGAGTAGLKDHVISLNADHLSCKSIMDKNDLVPEIQSSIREVLDLREPDRIDLKKLYKVPGGIYDYKYSILWPTRYWNYRFIARVLHPESGRYVEIYSNQPKIQFKTGLDLLIAHKKPKDASKKMLGSNKEMRIVGKDGILYNRFSGLAILPRSYVDTDDVQNQSCILKPGKAYAHDITYKFGIKSSFEDLGLYI